jgi:hypothetical protein
MTGLVLARGLLLRFALSVRRCVDKTQVVLDWELLIDRTPDRPTVVIGACNLIAYSILST